MISELWFRVIPRGRGCFIRGQHGLIGMPVSKSVRNAVDINYLLVFRGDGSQVLYVEGDQWNRTSAITAGVRWKSGWRRSGR